MAGCGMTAPAGGDRGPLPEGTGRASDPERLVPVGRVVGLHGVRGGLRIESWTDPREAIFNYQPWQLKTAGGELTLAALPLVRSQRIVARLEGIDDRDQAAALMGADILIRRSQLPDLPEGEYYWTDLEGLQVSNLQGEQLGRVQRLFETGANAVMVVNDSRRERLIPYVSGQYVVAVDLAAGTMRVDWDADF